MSTKNADQKFQETLEWGNTQIEQLLMHHTEVAWWVTIESYVSSPTVNIRIELAPDDDPAWFDAEGRLPKVTIHWDDKPFHTDVTWEMNGRFHMTGDKYSWAILRLLRVLQDDAPFAGGVRKSFMQQVVEVANEVHTVQRTLWEECLHPSEEDLQQEAEIRWNDHQQAYNI